MQLRNIAGQALIWFAFAAILAVLAQGPVFAPYAPDQALIKFSLAHLSQRLVPCRRLTEAERQQLPPTRRAFEVCEGGRAPTVVVLRLNGEVLLEQTIEPAGLRDEGRSYYLEYFPVPAGDHRLELAMRDTPREKGYDRVREFRLQLAGGGSALLEVGDDEVLLRQFPEGPA